MRIVCAVEGEAYVAHCAAMLHSLLSVHPAGGVQIDYLHGDDTSPVSRRRLREMVGRLGGEIRCHNVPDAWVDGLPVRGFTGKATWYRLFLSRLLPDAERAIYLDSDLIVNDSLTDLWTIDLGTSLLGAVTNVPPLGGERPVTVPDPRRLEFNAGVLVIDVSAMAGSGAEAELVAYARANGQDLPMRDQQVLNAVLRDHRLALHPRWNVMNSIQHWDYASTYFPPGQVEEARRLPAVRHFEGPSYNKPWHILAPDDCWALYAAHRRQTPWPRVRRSGLTPPNMSRYAKGRLIECARSWRTRR